MIRQHLKLGKLPHPQVLRVPQRIRINPAVRKRLVPVLAARILSPAQVLLRVLAKQYVVMDMKGQVLSTGELSNKDTRVTVPTSGSYIVKVGLGYRRVNIQK